VDFGHSFHTLINVPHLDTIAVQGAD